MPYLYGVHVELQYKFSTLDSNSRFRSTPVFKLPYFSCPSILNHKTHQVQVPNPDKPDEVVLRKHHFMMCAFCHWSTKGESTVYHWRQIIHYLFHRLWIIGFHSETYLFVSIYICKDSRLEIFVNLPPLRVIFTFIIWCIYSGIFVETTFNITIISINWLAGYRHFYKHIFQKFRFWGNVRSEFADVFPWGLKLYWNFKCCVTWAMLKLRTM